MPKESTLKRNCRDVINSRGGWARSFPQGIHSAGAADLIAVYRRYALVLETKLPTNKRGLTVRQAETLEKARAAGAITRVITRKQQVVNLLNAIDRKLDARD